MFDQRADNEAETSRWPDAIRYIVHAAIAGPGIVFVASLLEIIADSALETRGRNMDRYIFGPTFLVPGVLGLAGGLWLTRNLSRRASWLVMVPYALLMCWEILNNRDYAYSQPSARDYLWDNFVGQNCSATECLGELFITAPLVASMSYAFGAEAARLGRHLRKLIDRKTPR